MRVRTWTKPLTAERQFILRRVLVPRTGKGTGKRRYACSPNAHSYTVLALCKVAPVRPSGFATDECACSPHLLCFSFLSRAVSLLRCSARAAKTAALHRCAMPVQRGGRGTGGALRTLVVGAQLWLCAGTEGVRIPGFNAHIPPPPSTSAASSARRGRLGRCWYSILTLLLPLQAALAPVCAPTAFGKRRRSLLSSQGRSCLRCAQPHG